MPLNSKFQQFADILHIYANYTDRSDEALASGNRLKPKEYYGIDILLTIVEEFKGKSMEEIYEIISRMDDGK